MTNVPYQRKDIDGFPGYQIDTEGNVWSAWKSAGGKRIKTELHKLEGSLIKTDRHKEGRLTVCLGANGRNITFRVAYLVAKTFIPNPDYLPCLCHNDSNPLNNTITNLRWDTQKGNMRDRLNRRLYGLNKGSTNGSAKLTEMQVIYIKSLKYSSSYEISKWFNVAPRTIRDILQYKTWKHI